MLDISKGLRKDSVVKRSMAVQSTGERSNGLGVACMKVGRYVAIKQRGREEDEEGG